jgi:dolichyl-phosphate beta-glucosyltransferase
MGSQREEKFFLSVIIPAYNEETRVEQTLSKIRYYLSQKDYSSEIIVVDDGSCDETAGRAAEALKGMEHARVLSRSQNFGKGYSVKEGILQAKGKLILFSDADLSTPIEELDKFLPWIDRGFDVVIGSRALPESDIQVHQSFFRELLGKMFNVLVQILVMRGIKDTQCGFKLFRREAALDVFPRVKIKKFSFDVEALYLCRKLGYRIQQVPVVWRNSPQSRVRIFSSSLKMFLDLWRIRLSHRGVSKGRERERMGEK